MDEAADTAELDDADIALQKEPPLAMKQALEALWELKKRAKALTDERDAVIAKIEATHAFIKDHIYRFSVNGPQLRAALIATGFVHSKTINKNKYLSTQVQCTLSQYALRLTTHSATLFCTTEIPVTLASGIFIEEAVSFRLRYAKMLDAFAKRPITAASTPLLGFHPAGQYLSVYLDTGELPLSTIAISPADQPGGNDTFSPPQPVKPDILAQGIHSIFISIARRGEHPRFKVVDVSGGRMRAATNDTYSVYSHPALKDVSLSLHAGDAFQVAEILQRFRPEHTTLSISDDWQRLEDGTLTLLIKRPNQTIISGIDRTISEAETDAFARLSANREILWQIVTPFIYFLRIRQGERLGNICVSNMQQHSDRRSKNSELILSATSRFELGIEPSQRMPVLSLSSIFNPEDYDLTANYLIDFVILERLLRFSRCNQIELRLSDVGLLLTELGADWAANNLLQRQEF